MRRKRSNNDRTRITLISLAILLLLSLPVLISLEQKTQNLQQKAAASSPTLVRNEVVATDAKGDGSTYVPNGWGYHKTRIIRTGTDDVFVTYLKPDNSYAVMHRPPNGGWTEVNSGSAGSEPVNILRGPNNEIHVFPFPGSAGTMDDVVSKDNGQTFTSNPVAQGQWEQAQGYAGAGTNAAGNMVVVQTENDQPYHFWWANYTPGTGQWSFHTDTPPLGYSYVYVLPGASDVSIVGMRDVHWSTLGYPAGGTFDYVFNEIRLFHYNSLTNPTMQNYSLKEELPQSGSPNEILYVLDSYLDTTNKLHIIYWDASDQSDHHAIIQNNAIAKDVKLSVTAPWKVRMIQDTSGRFYFISTDNNKLNVYAGSAGDTDGTQLDPAISLDLGSNAGCNDDFDFCLPVTLANPRSGVPLANYVDGIYGNMQKVYYFRVQLTNSSSSPSSNPTSAPTATIVPSYVCAGTTNSICPTLTPTPSTTNLIPTDTPPSQQISSNPSNPSLNPSSVVLPSISFIPPNTGSNRHGHKGNIFNAIIGLFLSLLTFLLDLIKKLL